MAPTVTVPSLSPAGFWSDLARGASLPLRALRLLFHPRLFRLSAASAAVTAVTLLVLAWAALHASRALADWLAGGPGTWHQVAAVTLTVVLWVLLFAAGAVTVPNLVLAPLQDPLSETTEQLCRGDRAGADEPRPTLLRATAVSLGHTMLRLAFMTLGVVVLFPLNFLPAVGSVVWMIVSTAWSAFWLSVEHLSNPMARHLRPFGEVTRTLRARPGLALGLGGVLTIILWVPVVNCFLMPVAVVSGTLLYCGLEHGDRRPRDAVALS